MSRHSHTFLTILTDDALNSNLTFGAGGKDKDGKNVSGWGYYEVRLSTLHCHPIITQDFAIILILTTAVLCVRT